MVPHYAIGILALIMFASMLIYPKLLPASWRRFLFWLRCGRLFSTINAAGLSLTVRQFGKVPEIGGLRA